MKTSVRKSTAEEHTRDVLVDAAVSLLGEGDAESISLREVARRAGVSHAAPYNHFADKQALLKAVALRGFEGLERSMKEAQAIAGSSPGEQLVAAGIGYVLFARREPALFQLMFNRVSCPVDGVKSSQGAFQVLLGGVQALGRREEDALFAWAQVHGLAVMFTQGTLGPLGIPADRELAMTREHCQRIVAGWTAST